MLHILPTLTDGVIVLPEVVEELENGRRLGIELPDLADKDWLTVQAPVSSPALPLINDLGPGETAVLMLALELQETIAVLDDALARQVAETLKLKLTGTLGLLLDAKRNNLIPQVAPILDQLQSLRFHLAQHTRNAVLKLAGEEIP